MFVHDCNRTVTTVVATNAGSRGRRRCFHDEALAVVLVMMACLPAQEKKEVTLKGTIMCAKCALKEAKKCQTVIRVKEDGKDVTYYFDDKGNKEEYYEEICGGAKKDGVVIGHVHEKDGRSGSSPRK
jgi:hypothetical protein